MYQVVFLGTGATGQTLIVYTFATLALAQAFVGSMGGGSSYTITQTYSMTPPGGGGTPTCQTVTAGQVVVALVVTNALGTQQVLLYGPYTTLSAGNAAIAGRSYPGGCLAVTVQTPPTQPA
jgi:hypothetical protein